ncbi:MAG: hypothetical protein ABIH26_03715 [Candidatus Eisenbacteria bacterium]
MRTTSNATRSAWYRILSFSSSSSDVSTRTERLFPVAPPATRISSSSPLVEEVPYRVPLGVVLLARPPPVLLDRSVALRRPDRLDAVEIPVLEPEHDPVPPRAPLLEAERVLANAPESRVSDHVHPVDLVSPLGEADRDRVPAERLPLPDQGRIAGEKNRVRVSLHHRSGGGGAHLAVRPDRRSDRGDPLDVGLEDDRVPAERPRGLAERIELLDDRRAGHHDPVGEEESPAAAHAIGIPDQLHEYLAEGDPLLLLPPDLERVCGDVAGGVRDRHLPREKDPVPFLARPDEEDSPIGGDRAVPLDDEDARGEGQRLVLQIEDRLGPDRPSSVPVDAHRPVEMEETPRFPPGAAVAGGEDPPVPIEEADVPRDLEDARLAPEIAADQTVAGDVDGLLVRGLGAPGKSREDQKEEKKPRRGLPVHRLSGSPGFGSGGREDSGRGK